MRSQFRRGVAVVRIGAAASAPDKTDHLEAAKLSRREFSSSAAASAAAFAIAPRRVLGRAAHVPPSDRINLAVIGAGCQGLRHVKLLTAEPDVQVVAVCDVNAGSADYFDFDYADGIAGREPARQVVESCYAQRKRSGVYKGCAAYRDFRDMLQDEKHVDAVLVATPDHTHTVAAMQAVKLGKHVYCEKPLTHTIDEARKLAEAARKAKVATQMGNQHHASEIVRLQVEVIRSGVIGRVREVHAWSADDGRRGPWSPVRQRRWAVVGSDWSPGPDSPKDTPRVPPNLDWDLWLGPAPYRRYHPAYVPFKWRGWWDFASGALGDMGCHILDPIVWALELGPPIRVEASCTAVTSETPPVASVVHYDFPARGDAPPVRLAWYDGGLKPARPEELEEGRSLPPQGVLYIGESGKVLAGLGAGPRLLPESRMKDFRRPEPSLPRSKPPAMGGDSLSMSPHHREWIDACKGGPAPLSNFDYAGPLTETVLLGAIAIRSAKKLNWDAQNMKITNAPAANELVRTPYRAGWAL